MRIDFGFFDGRDSLCVAGWSERGELEAALLADGQRVPALHVMRQEIETRLHTFGFSHVTVETTLHPPWSSDWISEEARAKLKAFGLAPPPRHGGRLEVTFFAPTACPYCNSTDTRVKNEFGPTLCRAIYYCHACQQPFEQFKAL